MDTALSKQQVVSKFKSPGFRGMSIFYNGSEHDGKAHWNGDLLGLSVLARSIYCVSTYTLASDATS